ncbi:MAG: hypothetical protein OHK0013_32410 [Sandaracinaceae bacterium]
MARACCPICKQPLTGAAERGEPGSPFPFCSTRCKLVDLGAWLNESYRIAGERLEDLGDEVIAKLSPGSGGDA